MSILPDQREWQERRKLGLWSGIILGFIGLILTGVAVGFEWKPGNKPFTALLWVLWTLNPPAWILGEYSYVRRPPSNSEELKDRFDSFKYS
jgi:hypothetical protein